MEKTTIAHIMLERLEKQGITIEISPHVEGDIIEEHDWLMSGSNGPMFLERFGDLFQEICIEIDKGIALGEVTFLDDGTIIYL